MSGPRPAAAELTTLTIAALGGRGEGIAEPGGGRVFVPFTLPGETVEAAVEGDRGTLRAVLAPSADRIAPFCPYFGACGGCALQHMGPAAYAAFKRGLVETALRRAGIAAEVAALVDARGEGRRRVTLHARRTPGGAAAGYMAARSHHLTAIDRCPILVPALAAAPEIARAAAGLGGDCDVTLTATATGLDADVRPRRRAEARRLVPLGERFDLARLALDGEMIWQSRVPAVRMGRAVVPLPTAGFLQATAAAEEALAGLVLPSLAKARHVLDLFCGVGPFALRIAETAKVTAVDADGPSIAALRAAANTTQGLKPVETLARDLFRNPHAPAELGRYDAVVLDPPRAGAAAQAAELATAPKTLRTIVYVSCDPGTFARDAAVLAGGGWRLETVTPVDQFAWSAHVEIVGVFRR